MDCRKMQPFVKLSRVGEKEICIKIRKFDHPFPQVKVENVANCIICGNSTNDNDMDWGKRKSKSILSRKSQSLTNEFSTVIFQLLDIHNNDYLHLHKFFQEGHYCRSCFKKVSDLVEDFAELERIKERISEGRKLIEILLRETYSSGNPEQNYSKNQEGESESEGKIPIANLLTEELKRRTKKVKVQIQNRKSHSVVNPISDLKYENERLIKIEALNDEEQRPTVSTVCDDDDLNLDDSEGLPAEFDPDWVEVVVATATPKTMTPSASASSTTKTKAKKKKAREIPGIFKCDECAEVGIDVIFKWKKNIRRHWLRCHDPDRGQGQTSRKAKSVREHCVCDICGQIFCNASKLKGHKSSAHPPTSPTCEICSMKFQSDEERSAHALLHTPEAPFTCVLCALVTSSSVDLQRHMTVEHTDHVFLEPPKFKCEWEGCTSTKKIFKTDASFKYHMKRHQAAADPNYPFRCSICQLICDNNSHLAVHMKTHSNSAGSAAEFQCDICGNQFRHKGSLNIHKEKHLVASGVAKHKYVCKICGKRFPEKARLRIHEEIHSGVQHVCDICGKSFGVSQNLVQHKRTHFKDKYPRKVRGENGKWVIKQNLLQESQTGEGEEIK